MTYYIRDISLVSVDDTPFDDDFLSDDGELAEAFIKHHDKITLEIKPKPLGVITK